MKVRVSLVVDEKELEKLKELSIKEERSISYMIQKAISEYIADK